MSKRNSPVEKRLFPERNLFFLPTFFTDLTLPQEEQRKNSLLDRNSSSRSSFTDSSEMSDRSLKRKRKCNKKKRDLKRKTNEK
mmetsp:Transcript_9393/g.12645  ORF Transcript_9393/g.12645 Transcript_9393/m.12645 type:complete len:83 (-) Transcript_9393:42-290(-)